MVFEKKADHTPTVTKVVGVFVRFQIAPLHSLVLQLARMDILQTRTLVTSVRALHDLG
jgi:hypothetical protein